MPAPTSRAKGMPLARRSASTACSAVSQSAGACSAAPGDGRSVGYTATARATVFPAPSRMSAFRLEVPRSSPSNSGLWPGTAPLVSVRRSTIAPLFQAEVLAAQVVEAAAVFRQQDDLLVVGELKQCLVHLRADARAGEVARQRQGAAEVHRDGAGLRR